MTFILEPGAAPTEEFPWVAAPPWWNRRIGISLTSTQYRQVRRALGEYGCPFLTVAKGSALRSKLFSTRQVGDTVINLAQLEDRYALWLYWNIHGGLHDLLKVRPDLAFLEYLPLEPPDPPPFYPHIWRSKRDHDSCFAQVTNVLTDIGTWDRTARRRKEVYCWEVSGPGAVTFSRQPLHTPPGTLSFRDRQHLPGRSLLTKEHGLTFLLSTQPDIWNSIGDLKYEFEPL